VRLSALGIYALVILAVLSCPSTSTQAQTFLGREFSGVKRIAILPPRITVYELGAGGVIEQIDEWSVRASQSVTAALDKELKLRPGLESEVVQIDTLSQKQKSELEDLQLLYDVVHESVRRHVLGLQVEHFEEKILGFDYSLGKETANLNFPGVDAFFVIKGFDQISSAGRYALQATSMIAGAALGVIVVPKGGLTVLTLALVHAVTGDVLWFTPGAAAGGTDLRDPSSVALLLKRLFRQFPIRQPYEPPNDPPKAFED
jgi:hypothetical protein